MSGILKTWGTILECFYFKDSSVPWEIFERKSDVLSDEILKVRLDSKTLKLIDHDAYLEPDTYWSVKSVDLTHCNVELELPQPIENFEYYLKVRAKLIRRVETLLKKYYGSKNLNDSQGA